ncbi:MAG: hypothetical protein ACE5K7_03960 [Phycisphaerae bacterium]
MNRWRVKGPIERILEALQIRLDAEGWIDWDLWCVDGSSVRAHGSAAREGKKGAATATGPCSGPLARWLGQQDPRGH